MERWMYYIKYYTGLETTETSRYVKKAGKDTQSERLSAVSLQSDIETATTTVDLLRDHFISTADHAIAHKDLVERLDQIMAEPNVADTEDRVLATITHVSEQLKEFLNTTDARRQGKKHAVRDDISALGKLLQAGTEGAQRLADTTTVTKTASERLATSFHTDRLNSRIILGLYPYRIYNTKDLEDGPDIRKSGSDLVSRVPRD